MCYTDNTAVGVADANKVSSAAQTSTERNENFVSFTGHCAALMARVFLQYKHTLFAV